MELNHRPMLSVENLSVVYAGNSVPALAGVTLSVGAGEGVALMGANGAGKTTLLRSAMALTHPAHGSLHVAGRNTVGLGPEDLADVAGYLFQQPEAQLFEPTVRAELQFGPRQLGWDDARSAAGAERLMDELGLREVAEVHPYDLPAPRRRIVALAATLAAQPRLLLLDEPTAGFDRAGRQLVARAVRRARVEGAAVVAVTHDAEFAIEALDRGIVLRRGRIDADGAVAEVLDAGADVPGLPPAAALARALDLPATSLRFDSVAEALAARCRSRG